VTEDIQTPEILATVGRFDYSTGVLKRPHDGGPARFYSTIAAWETTEAFYAAGMERQLADMQRDHNAAEKKVGELLLRSQEQEGAIATLQRQLLEAKAPSPAEAPLPPWPAAAPAAHDEPRARAVVAAAPPVPIAPSDPPIPPLPRHQKQPCGVDGCASLMAIGTPMATHRMRRHPAWHAQQMALGRDTAVRGMALIAIPDADLPPATPLPPTQVAPAPREPGPPTPNAPAMPDAVRDQQRRQLERQFASLGAAPFTCSACGKSAHAQSVTDETRCQKCQTEGRYADDAVIAVRT